MTVLDQDWSVVQAGTIDSLCPSAKVLITAVGQEVLETHNTKNNEANADILAPSV